MEINELNAHPRAYSPRENCQRTAREKCGSGEGGGQPAGEASDADNSELVYDTSGEIEYEDDLDASGKHKHTITRFIIT